MENVEWVYDSAKETWHQEKLHEMKKKMHKMTMDQIEESKFSILENYLSSLTLKL